jgi:outer membrane receptor protein involved in Fe transport
MHARTDISYTGSAWDTDINIVKTTPYYRVSSALGVERRDLSVELFVTNLLNDQTWNYVSKVPDVTEFTFAKQGVLVQPAPPREVGVRLKYKFN